MKKALLGIALVGCSVEIKPMQPPPPLPDMEWTPQATCRTPAIPSGPWFTEITADVGLAKQGDFEPVATSIIAGDIDNDGFVDFIATFFPLAEGSDGNEAHAIRVHESAESRRSLAENFRRHLRSLRPERHA